ncbi:MAG TPA: HEPN domain-containing protein, partial [Flavobacteriaceae bacterium]|nr:HEPN domain-containing protein [Flavobacteriaceae bacterium]
MEDNFNAEKIIHHWKISSNRNYQTMRHLLETKDNNWALFLGHLVLEKLLKAHYVKNLRKHSIFTHDLLRLASKTNL